MQNFFREFGFFKEYRNRDVMYCTSCNIRWAKESKLSRILVFGFIITKLKRNKLQKSKVFCSDDFYPNLWLHCRPWPWPWYWQHCKHHCYFHRILKVSCFTRRLWSFIMIFINSWKLFWRTIICLYYNDELRSNDGFCIPNALFRSS